MRIGKKKIYLKLYCFVVVLGDSRHAVAVVTSGCVWTSEKKNFRALAYEVARAECHRIRRLLRSVFTPCHGTNQIGQADRINRPGKSKNDPHTQAEHRTHENPQFGERARLFVDSVSTLRVG